ncbi:MAG TPA: CHASE3 domain-containing protein [Gemmatimonadales bacterium]|nr:CHASE3 domain-containing protein [Gemmatimonadales bacterium]
MSPPRQITPIALRTKVGITLAGFLLLVMGPAFLAYRSSTAYLATSTQVAAEQSSVAELRAVYSLIQDLESGQRGFVITGDPAFLNFYTAAHAQVLPRLRALRPLLSITVHGPALADSLEALARAKMDGIERIIEARRSQGFEAARAIVAGGRGRVLMNEIRAQVALVDAAARRELLMTRDEAMAQRRTALYGLAVSGIAALTLALGAGFLISRDIAEDRAEREQLTHEGAALSSQLAGISAELAAQDLHLRAIVSAVPVALVSIDRAGLVSFWSPVAEQMFGYTAGEVVGHPLPIVPEDRQGEYDRFRETVLAGTAFSGRETRRVRKDGAEVDVAVSTAPLRNASGEVEGLVAAYVDVRAQRLLQEELRQSQKMEALGRLAGGVAHDFNNLLTAILGFADRVRRGLPPESAHLADLEEVVVAAERATALSRQLLTFSRPQAVAPKAIDVNAVVRAMEPMLRRLLGERVDLRVNLPANTGRVLADTHHIEQVLLNLCINARDAMPGGGRLLVETGQTELAAGYLDLHPELSPGTYVMLSVTDTGVGMDEATRARLFEPFFTTKGGMGTGLGLATVYGIVKQAGGGIVVSSEPGGGTAFKVYLPLAPAGAEPVAPPVPAALPMLPVGASAVVVDDNSAVRSLTVALLEDEGFAVRGYASGEEALADLPTIDRLDLLVTDLVLGNMDGATLATRLRERYQALPVVYMSGYTADTEMVRALGRQPRVRFLDKPYRAGTLLAAIAEVMAEPPSPA